MMGWKNYLGVALLSIASAQSWATTLTVAPTPASAAPGSTISVAVNVTDVANLAGYGFGFSFNASVLRFTGFTGGAFLGSGGASTDQGIIGVDNTAGTIDYAYGTIVSDLSGVSGDGTLGYFTFEALTAGSSALTLSDALLVSSINGADGFPTTIATAVVNGAVIVTPAAPPGGDVPEPASLALVGIGALAAGALRRRRVGVAAARA